MTSTWVFLDAPAHHWISGGTGPQEWWPGPAPDASLVFVWLASWACLQRGNCNGYHGGHRGAIGPAICHATGVVRYSVSPICLEGLPVLSDPIGKNLSSEHIMTSPAGTQCNKATLCETLYPLAIIITLLVNHHCYSSLLI